MTTVKFLKCTLLRENYVKDLGFHLRFKILISASFENHTLRHNLPCHTLKVKFLVFVSWDLTSQTSLKTYPFNHKRPQSPRCIVAEPLCPRRTPQGLHLVCRCGSRALGCSQLGAQNQGGEGSRSFHTRCPSLQCASSWFLSTLPPLSKFRLSVQGVQRFGMRPRRWQRTNFVYFVYLFCITKFSPLIFYKHFDILLNFPQMSSIWRRIIGHLVHLQTPVI